NAIFWNAITGWMDLGNAFVAKIFDEIMLEVDPQGAGGTVIEVKVFYDYSATAGDSFVIGGSTAGRCWIGLGLHMAADANQSNAISNYGRQASVIAFQFFGTAQGYRPTLYGLKFRFREIGEMTTGVIFDWSDLGHKY